MVGQAPLRLCVALIGVFAGDAEQQIEVHTKTSKLPSKLCWLTRLRYPVLLCAPGLLALLLYLWPSRERRAGVFPLVHASALRRALFERLTLNKRRVFGLYVKATLYSLFFEKGLRAKGLLCVAPFLVRAGYRESEPPGDFEDTRICFPVSGKAVSIRRSALPVDIRGMLTLASWNTN